MCRPCLAESADGKYSDAQLSEVRLPNAPSTDDFQCALNERLPLRYSTIPIAILVLPTSLPATLHLPAVFRRCPHAQLWPTWPPTQLVRRPQRPLAGMYGLGPNKHDILIGLLLPRKSQHETHHDSLKGTLSKSKIFTHHARRHIDEMFVNLDRQRRSGLGLHLRPPALRPHREICCRPSRGLTRRKQAGPR